MDCIFCKIANKEIASKILYENDLVVVIMDLNPVSDGHSLVIPKKHYTDILEVDNEMLIEMFRVAKMIGKKLEEKLNCKALTYLINYGDDQQVKHLHLHVIPDYQQSLKNHHVADLDTIYKKITG